MSRDQTWKQEWGYDVGKGCNSCGLDFTKNNHRQCSFPTCLNNARFHFSADHALLCTGYAEIRPQIRKAGARWLQSKCFSV